MNSPSDSLETIVIEPTTPANTCVIWLHGLGASGDDFVPIAKQLRLPKTCSMRFVFPHAPIRPVTLNNGLSMRAWFDVSQLSLDNRIDEAGLRRAEQQIKTLIDGQVAAGISPERIVLAGFSQGGALALHVGLRYPQRLAGLIALSCFLPLADQVQGEASQASQGMPIFMAQGEFDPIIQFAWAEQSKKILEALSYPVTWHAFSMQHEVNHEVILAIDVWMNLHL